jgi:hypothetical protein
MFVEHHPAMLQKAGNCLRPDGEYVREKLKAVDL